MMTKYRLLGAALMLGLAGVSPRVFAAEIPDAGAVTAPEAVGVNIHFTQPRAGEMEMLQSGGVHWVRMDFKWKLTEKTAGEYDFSAYDGLLRELETHGMRGLFILDYSNPLYDQDLSPYTDGGRAAFAKWAAAAVSHFKGHGIWWEMYNEPNVPSMWRPTPNPENYILLGLAVGKAIRAAAPGEVFIGPGLSRTENLSFLELCLKAGLLEYWDAVSVHPYRDVPPEAVALDYRRLRYLIARYAPPGKRVPVLSGEWGYTTSTNGHTTEEMQGKYLPRQWMCNLANEVPLSIWYDWRDDGTNPADNEHRYGTVRNGYLASQQPVYEAKPAYLAAKTFGEQLKGFRFNKRLYTGDERDYVLLFENGAQACIAAWTTRTEAVTVTVPASAGKFGVTDYLGTAQPEVQAGAEGLRLQLTGGPVYVKPEGANPILQLALGWQRAPLEVVSRSGETMVSLKYANVTGGTLRVTAEGEASVPVAPGKSVALSMPVRSGAPDGPAQLALTVDQGGTPVRFCQVTQLQAPFEVTPLPPVGRKLLIKLRSRLNEPWRGKLALAKSAGLDPVVAEVPVEFAGRQSEQVAAIELKSAPAGRYEVGLTLKDAAGGTLVSLPAVRQVALEPAALRGDKLAESLAAQAEGDPAVGARLELSSYSEAALAANDAVKLTYSLEPGWKFARLVPRVDALSSIEGQPKSLSMWLWSKSLNFRSGMRFVDSTGQIFQSRIADFYDPFVWNGWRYASFPMNSAASTHWGGANDGVIHYPIKLDSLYIQDKMEKGKLETGEVLLMGVGYGY